MGSLRALAAAGSETVGVGDVVTLRPVAQADLPELLRLVWDRAVSGEYESFGYRMDWVAELERRWQEDRLISDERSYLAVEASGACAGWVNWRTIPRSSTFVIGIALFPDHRGHGVGTEAQRQLVAYLFDTTAVHRLEADTEVGNVAEQRSLEAVGFQREGVQRGLHFRGGQWRDSVMYGLVRDDLTDPDSRSRASLSRRMAIAVDGSAGLGDLVGDEAVDPEIDQRP
jgi:RimJ/RimL family protein N-acetyltransferase